MLVLIGLLGCRSVAPSGEEPLPIPSIAVAERGYAGSPLGGIVSGGAARLEAEPRNAVLLRLEVEWIEHDPGAVGESITGVARMIEARRGSEPIQARLRIGSSIRVVRGGAAAAFAADVEGGAYGRRRSIASGTRALLAGAAQVLELRGNSRGGAVELAVEVQRTLERRIELALVLDGEVAQEHDAHPAVGPSEVGRVAWRELVVIAANEDERLTLVCPGLFAGAEDGALRLTLAVEPPQDDPAFADAVRAAREEAARSERALEERAQRVEEREKRERERRSALESLARADIRRSALVFLSGAARAELCSDLALVADDVVLGELVTALTAGSGDEHDLARDGEALAWHLERGAWSFLVAKLDGDAPVAEELRGLLVRHAGELARSSGALADVIAASASAEQLARRLREENRAMLEDANPAARIRAFDWLAARGWEPKGYDPLAGDEARRAALDAAEGALR